MAIPAILANQVKSTGTCAPNALLRLDIDRPNITSGTIIMRFKDRERVLV